LPLLFAKPTWVSANENGEDIQAGINIRAEDNEDKTKKVHSLGKSIDRDVQIKLKAISADHCRITYNNEKGWAVTE
jgi:SH3-like domain-containing protein